jgi:hypothetical protein
MTGVVTRGCGSIMGHSKVMARFVGNYSCGICRIYARTWRERQEIKIWRIGVIVASEISALYPVDYSYVCNSTTPALLLKSIVIRNYGVCTKVAVTT